VAGLDALPATPRLARIGRALAADVTLIARALGGCGPASTTCWSRCPQPRGPRTERRARAGGHHRHVHRRRPRRASSSGRLLLIRKRSATRNLTQGSPGRERTRRQAPELLRPAKA
jgi:hypothetical protein